MRIVMNRVTGKTVALPSKQFAEYQKSCAAFIPERRAMISEPVEVSAVFYMGTRRRVDLTNLLEAIDDILVHYGVLADDNSNIIVSHDGSRVYYDKEKPRTVVTIRKI